MRVLRGRLHDEQRRLDASGATQHRRERAAVTLRREDAAHTRTHTRTHSIRAAHTGHARKAHAGAARARAAPTYTVQAPCAGPEACALRLRAAQVDEEGYAYRVCRGKKLGRRRAAALCSAPLCSRLADPASQVAGFERRINARAGTVAGAARSHRALACNARDNRKLFEC
eukprot:4761292-Pleurochrysis_carterae.AAC.3